MCLAFTSLDIYLHIFFVSEKTTVISVSSSTEPSSSDALPSENEDVAMVNNMHKKDPFFVASTKKSGTNFLKKQQRNYLCLI